MNELNWKQVLEIETYINKVIDDNVTMFEKMFWDQGKKEYLTLDKKKYYTLSDLKEYFYEKYPNNEYYKGAHEVIQELFTISLSGVCRLTTASNHKLLEKSLYLRKQKTNSNAKRKI
ncbi:hypothetical protein [Aureispira anguillae]|uniref:Uncharacterized protein n=1 Tax=Aureispira anguillae TaxID=2864201 RepID=A0A915VK98_9BACT|nr:hypothetical protein [Aureispira anguillae]BDS09588.1 hypothetical protein AsAng_0002920 [Aureispira anguillae]